MQCGFKVIACLAVWAQLLLPKVGEERNHQQYRLNDGLIAMALWLSDWLLLCTECSAFTIWQSLPEMNAAQILLWAAVAWMPYLPLNRWVRGGASVCCMGITLLPTEIQGSFILQVAALGEESPGARPSGSASFRVHQVWFLFSIMVGRKVSLESFWEISPKTKLTVQEKA